MIKKNKISLEDNKTWQDYIKNPTDISDKDNSIKKNISSTPRFKYDLQTI